MATPPDNHQAPLKYQTWTLKVPIHCEGCKKKVRKILQSIDGVYMTTIDSQQHKVIVTGNIEAGTLLKKLSKSGKPAQLWPDHNKPKEMILEPPTNMEEDKDKPKPKLNDEQVNQNPEKTPTDPTQPPREGGNNQDGQIKKKKKKNKGQNSNSTDTNNVPSAEAPQPPPQPQPQPTPPPESTPPPPPEQVMPPLESLKPPPPSPPPEVVAPPQGPPPTRPPMEQQEVPIESLNLGPPNMPCPPSMHHQHQAHHPYFRPPMNNPGYMNMPPILAHNPAPAPPPMGVSYSMAQPRTSGSYYVPPAYPYYAYPHHPMMQNFPLPPPPRPINEYYDDHDQYDHRDYNDDAASQCRLM